MLPAPLKKVRVALSDCIRDLDPAPVALDLTRLGPDVLLSCQVASPGRRHRTMVIEKLVPATIAQNELNSVATRPPAIVLEGDHSPLLSPAGGESVRLRHVLCSTLHDVDHVLRGFADSYRLFGL